VRLFLALLAASAAFGQGLPDPLDPREVRSASGAAVLFVDPSDDDGAGAGLHRLTVGGEVAWERELPYTLFEAAVADDGTVVGASYSQGRQRYGGRFLVTVIDPSGEVLAQHEQEREAVIMHAPASPTCRRVLVLEGQVQALVRVIRPAPREADEAWWIYDLSTGERLAAHSPYALFGRSRDSRIVRDLATLPGTARRAVSCPRLGGTYALHVALVDPSWREVWSERVDFTEDQRGWEQGEFMPPSAGRIGVQVEEGVALSWEVTSTPEGWRVGAGERSRVVRQAEPSAPIRLELELLERVALGTPDPAAEDHLMEWRALASGEVETFWRSGPAYRWRRFGADGALAAEHEVDLGGPDGAVHAVRLSSGDWLLTLDPYDDRAHPQQAWVLDVNTGDRRELPAEWGRGTTALTTTADGGFVLFARQVLRYDGSGRLLWRARASGRDVVETARSEVWVLRGKDILVLSSEGEELRTIELAAALGQAPNYPSNLEPDLEGGVLFEDFNGDPPLWRIDAEGNAEPAPALRRVDGRAPAEYARTARVGADGRLWAAQGGVIARFDERGVVDRELGSPPDTGRPTVFWAAGLTPEGHLAILDGPTATLHVVRADGRILRRRPAPPGLLDDEPKWASITFDAAGNAWVPGKLSGALRSHPWTVFGADGEVVAESLVSDEVAFAGGARFESDLDLVHVVSEVGRRTLSRLPDRRWLRFPHVVDDHAGGVAVSSRGVLVRYDEAGEVVDTHEASAGWATALRGDVLAFPHDGGLVLRRLSTGARYLGVLPGLEEARLRAFLPPGGEEVWVLDQGALELWRFRLPAELQG